jgi:hypothetical protein
MENKPHTSFHHFYHFYHDQSEPSQNTIIATECEPVAAIEIHPVALPNSLYSVSPSNYIVVDDIETGVLPPEPVVHQPPKEDCCVCCPLSYETIICFGNCCRCCIGTFAVFMCIVVVWSISGKP